ncbi:GNAT family N-acetyltransferase [Streptomyces sp. NPDC050625]|uniref:GNAT family N-acetyltransferase n=1 Tax=Streptomyces sp. NPDC050625 TaxID=3154629 RepID=UPI00341940D8
MKHALLMSSGRVVYMMKVQNSDENGDIVFKELERGDDPQLRSDLFSLLCELRPGMSQQLFGELTSVGIVQGLRYLVAYSGDGKPLAAAGYRVLYTSRGRMLYVDDLVTTGSERSRGIAGAVMSELKSRARLVGCDRIELDSGVTNTSAHRFYLRNQLDIKAFHFSGLVEAP